MKKIYLFVLATVLFFSQSAKAQYALPSYTIGCSSSDYIDNVSTTMGVSNITNNATGCNGATPNNYTFFSGMTVSQIQGQSFNFSVQAGTAYGQGFRIWIDWNQDFSFGGPGEDVYVSPNSATAPFTGTITVPFTAVPGVTRMRVLCRYSTVPGIGDWNATGMAYGECEDYNMMVIGSTPCSGTPSAGVANFIPGCPATISATGFTLAGGLTWQWQKRVGCTGSWSNINGATSPNFVIPGQTAPTYYRMFIVCTASGQSDTTAPLFVNSLNPCYCTAGGQYSFYETITNVIINNRPNVTPCVNATYSNFNSLTPPKLSIGQNVPLSVSITNCYGFVYQNYGVAVFIDFDRDGTYSTAERVYASGSNTPVANTTAIYQSNFQVPVGAKAGVTGMRVILDDYGSAGTAITGCATPTYGEVEDYLVNIEYVPTVSGDGLHCSSENSFTLASTAPNIGASSYSYLWQFPDGSYHTDSSYVLPATPGPTGPSGTYSVRVLTYPCGGTGIPDTSGTKTIQIYVSQTPPPPVVAPLITFCQNSLADSIPIYGQNLQWYSVATGGTPTTTAPIVNTTQTGSFTYYVAQSLNGCESNRVPVTVQVVPPAPPPTVTSPVSYCQNETSVPLSAVGQNLLWYSTDTGGVGTPIVPTPTTVAQGKTYWYVTQTIDGCESIRVPIEIMVNYRPNALMTASRPYVCAGDTLTFTYYGNADGDTGVTFNWTFPTGTTVLSGTGQGPYVVRFDSAGQPMLKLIADNHGCMSPEAKYLVEVRALPRFDIDMQDQACVGDVVNVASLQITPAIDSFLWDFDGGTKTYASETAGPYGIIWTSSGQKTVTVVATDNACKSAPVQDVITIRELPDASIRRVNGGNKICAGDSVLLESSYRWDYTYFWQPTQYFSEQNQYRQWARIDYGRMVSLQITDGFNCTSTDSIWLKPENCCEVYFPSAFSPNGDGRNDIFRPITQGHQKISLFVVKNRWGQQVYEGLDDRGGWDGTFTGKAQDVGVYFYYIKYKCADGKYYEEKGEVTLVR